MPVHPVPPDGRACEHRRRLPVELGTRLRPSADGFVTGVRFYEAAGGPGTHTGSLWSPSGALLATGSFTGETASGWQTMVFTDEVNGPLTWPATGAQPNGVYQYGGGGVFPVGSGAGSNYWVDAVFQN